MIRSEMLPIGDARVMPWCASNESAPTVLESGTISVKLPSFIRRLFLRECRLNTTWYNLRFILQEFRKILLPLILQEFRKILLPLICDLDGFSTVTQRR